MAQDKVNMPSSGGGILRYYEGYKSKVEIKPIYVLAFIVVVIILEIYLYKFVSF